MYNEIVKKKNNSMHFENFFLIEKNYVISDICATYYIIMHDMFLLTVLFDIIIV